MKRIHFNNYQSASNIILMAIMLVCLVFLFLEGRIQNPFWSSVVDWLEPLPYLAGVIYYGRTFAFRNYFSYTKFVFQLRINSRWKNGYTAFKDVTEIAFDGDQLSIWTVNKHRPEVFVLGDIDPRDRERLMGILRAKIPHAVRA